MNWFMAFILINAVLHAVFGGIIIYDEFLPPLLQLMVLPQLKIRRPII